MSDKNPMQPVIIASDGVIRFKANQIVEFVLANARVDMNDIAKYGFTDEDQMQFAQLIGYSVSGYSDLSYASDESCKKAEAARDKLREE